jgi:hypothetical protein
MTVINAKPSQRRLDKHPRLARIARKSSHLSHSATMPQV